jgi:ubiquinone/menaquinone biosynthesis C-methylase UbiE
MTSRPLPIYPIHTIDADMANDITKQNQVAYDQLVEEYARRNHNTVADALRIGAEQLARHVGPAGKIIEVGCGTGRDMAWLESLGLRVTGIDLSWGMLSYARGSVTGALLQMDMRCLTFQAACFDGAWCCASLLHLPKREAPLALQEIHRVLKAQAMLVLFVQQGAGESWETGYGSSVRRFYARYQQAEMVAMLDECRFRVQETASNDVGTHHWLRFTALAV